VTPAMPVQGQDALVSVAIRNLGLAAAGAFQADWYLDPTSPPGVGDPGTLSWQVTGLGPGEVIVLSQIFVFSQADDFPVWAQADTLDQVVEGDESNNVAGPKCGRC